MNLYRTALNSYYQEQGIYPLTFACPHAAICRACAYPNPMTECRMTHVGSLYGKQYPRIVVVSLDPPSGLPPEAENRTIEAEGKRIESLVPDPNNVHWIATNIIVKDILRLWGYPSKPNEATIGQSYSGRDKPIVSMYFAHVNAAKCSMNRKGKKQAPAQVHARCSGSYLAGELAILQPQIIISQGVRANKAVGEACENPLEPPHHLVAVNTLPIGDGALWLAMHHPACGGLRHIRHYWPEYVGAIQTRFGIEGNLSK